MSNGYKMTQKPIARQMSAPAYDWKEIHGYVKTKFGIDLRDCNGKYERTDMKMDQLDMLPHLDFWSWVVNTYQVRQGGYFDLPVREYKNPNFGAAQFVYELFELLNKEFPEANGNLHCYYSGEDI